MGEEEEEGLKISRGIMAIYTFIHNLRNLRSLSLHVFSRDLRIWVLYRLLPYGFGSGGGDTSASWENSLSFGGTEESTAFKR